MKSMQYPSTGIAGRPQAGALTNEPGESGSYDPLVGRKVWTKWPDDNQYYEAVITDYNPVEVSYLSLLYISVLVPNLRFLISFISFFQH